MIITTVKLTLLINCYLNSLWHAYLIRTCYCSMYYYSQFTRGLHAEAACNHSDYEESTPSWRL